MLKGGEERAVRTGVSQEARAQGYLFEIEAPGTIVSTK